MPVIGKKLRSRWSLLMQASMALWLVLLVSHPSQARNMRGSVSDDPIKFAKVLLVSERDEPAMVYCYVDIAIYKNGRSSLCAAARDEINKTAIEFGYRPLGQEDEKSLFECISEIFRQLSERRN